MSPRLLHGVGIVIGLATGLLLVHVAFSDHGGACISHPGVAAPSNDPSPAVARPPKPIPCDAVVSSPIGTTMDAMASEPVVLEAAFTGADADLSLTDSFVIETILPSRTDLQTFSSPSSDIITIAVSGSAVPRTGGSGLTGGTTVAAGFAGDHSRGGGGSGSSSVMTGWSSSAAAPSLNRAVNQTGRPGGADAAGSTQDTGRGVVTGPPVWSDPLVVETLQGLRSLPKIHYYWQPQTGILNAEESRVLYELARITHTLCVAAEWTTASQIDRCVRIARDLNTEDRQIPVSIGVNMQPWHRKFGADLPPMDRGPTYWEEIEYTRERLSSIRDWLAESNNEHSVNIEVSAFLLDCERFRMESDDDRWNSAMREALDAIHAEVASVFPAAQIVWYGRGMTMNTLNTSCRMNRFWTGGEITPVLSCSLYELPKPDRTRILFEETVHLGDEKGIPQVIPYIALAAGYDCSEAGRIWRKNWPYDPKFSRDFGASFNGGDSLYDRAPAGVFYPPPFDSRAPYWLNHFVAYVKGATTSFIE